MVSIVQGLYQYDRQFVAQGIMGARPESRFLLQLSMSTKPPVVEGGHCCTRGSLHRSSRSHTLTRPARRPALWGYCSTASLPIRLVPRVPLSPPPLHLWQVAARMMQPSYRVAS
jgi:hypothetical protein